MAFGRGATLDRFICEELRDLEVIIGGDMILPSSNPGAGEGDREMYWAVPLEAARSSIGIVRDLVGDPRNMLEGYCLEVLTVSCFLGIVLGEENTRLRGYIHLLPEVGDSGRPLANLPSSKRSPYAPPSRLVAFRTVRRHVARSLFLKG